MIRQTRTSTLSHYSTHSRSTSRTATWTEDLTAPTITATGNDAPLGCNPAAAAIDAALGSATATDACDRQTVMFKKGTIIGDGCIISKKRTFTATDICGNTATTSRTATWT